jgi:hypothetical protein
VFHRTVTKFHLKKPERYSEDIDLVQVEAGPIGSIMDGVHQSLDSWLGDGRDPQSARDGAGWIFRRRWSMEKKEIHCRLQPSSSSILYPTRIALGPV